MRQWALAWGRRSEAVSQASRDIQRAVSVLGEPERASSPPPSCSPWYFMFIAIVVGFTASFFLIYHFH